MKLVNTPGLAEKLGVSTTTIQRWHRFGFIEPAEFVTGRPRWHVPDVKKAVIAATFGGRRRPRLEKAPRLPLPENREEP